MKKYFYFIHFYSAEAALDQPCLLALDAPQLDGAVEVIVSHLAATTGRAGEHPVVAAPGADLLHRLPVLVGRHQRPQLPALVQPLHLLGVAQELPVDEDQGKGQV